MKRKLKAGLLGALGLAFIIIIASLFTHQMNRTIENNTMNTINELARHDQVAIQNFVETKWYELRGIQSRLEVYDCEEILEVQERLNLERSTGDFHTLYLVAEDGSVYTDRYMVYPQSELDILRYLYGGEEQIARRYDISTTTESQKEVLLYAVRLENYVVEGIHFVALAGISNINQIQDKMMIHSFVKNGESRGYSSVVNLNGDFIVNVKRTVSLGQQENMFENLAEGTLELGWSTQRVAEQMARKESFHLYYTDAAGDEKLIYFMPIENTDWYFLLVVMQQVFTEQSREFIILCATVLAAVLLVILGILIFAQRSRSRMIKADAEAKARSEFLSNMSHEIRTPLNGIIGLLHLMQANLGLGEQEKMSDWLGKANGTANYLLALVSDILDMSKLQAGKMEFSMKPFLLELCMDAVSSMQRHAIEGRGVNFVVQQEITVPCVIGDEVRIKQVLMNILGNASKFTPEGGTITLTLKQEPERAGRVNTIFTCEDTGVGMSAQFLETIWDSFTQERNQVSDGTQGTGLGMAITKGFVDAMGGHISVKSEQGVGSTFTIALPLEVALAADQRELTRESGKPGPVDIRRVKLLVAEDNALNAEILTDILEGEGFEVTLAHNGQEAVDLFVHSISGEFSAILMDMQMPVMDGCQAAAKIRSLNRPDAKRIPIFACTANTFQEDRDRALASGMSDFLTKPIDVNILLSKLRGEE